MPKRSLSEIIGLFSHQFAQFEAIASKGVFSDLTMKQVFYLETIGNMDKPTFTELAKKLGLSKPSISAIVDKLIQKNYLQKQLDPDDKRSYRICLTKQGIELNNKHQAMHDGLAEHLTNVLTEEEQEKLAMVLNKIVNSLQ
jgi:DNA-binding MarR family transcriptional regulator